MINFPAVIAGTLFLIATASCNYSSTDSVKNQAISDSAKNNVSAYIQILDTEALQVLDSSTAIELIAGGFKWTEGPLYIPAEKALLFSDIPDNKIYKWTEAGGTVTYLQPSGFTGKLYKGREPGSNGLLLNSNNELILLQHGDRRIVKMDAPLSAPRASFITLIDAYNGKKLNSPNDGVFTKDGNLYFNDPPYRLADGLEDSLKQLAFQGVFLLRHTGELVLVTDELKFPNGVTLSPDEKFLYVANSDPFNKMWMKYELNEKGLIKSRAQFYRSVQDEGVDNGNPDGLKMNQVGYLFATGPGGILIFNPAGKLIARIFTGQLTSNCTLANNEKDLFITCTSNVMRVKLK